MEQEAQQLIKQHLSIDAPSYHELIQCHFTGFMHYYLQQSTNFQTMSTTADFDVTMKLATIDQPGVNKKLLFILVSIISLWIFLKKNFV